MTKRCGDVSGTLTASLVRPYHASPVACRAHGLDQQTESLTERLHVRTVLIKCIARGLGVVNACTRIRMSSQGTCYVLPDSSSCQSASGSSQLSCGEYIGMTLLSVRVFFRHHHACHPSTCAALHRM